MKLRIAGGLAAFALVAALAIVPMMASGAGGSSSPTISGSDSLTWLPMEVAIMPGGTVTFQDTSTTVAHGVVWTSGPETPSCEGVPIDQAKVNWKGTCTFSQEGVYEFYCYVHGRAMSGKVFVNAAGTTTSGTTSVSSSSSSSTTSAKATTTTQTSVAGPSSPAMPMQMGGEGGSAAFLALFSTVTAVASTVPANGDLNPYGIALVPKSIGKLRAGEMLVSNFNDKANDQGTGTTIVQISTAGKRSLFATVNAKRLPGRCPGGVGLTTALGVLPNGYVVVGSLPTSNGKSATAKSGCLIVLDSAGKAVETIAGSQIQGPWDMAVVSKGSASTLFVSNVLSGGAAKARKTIENSTVLRIRLSSAAGRAPKVLGERVIAKGIPWRDSPEALVVGPTGVALARNGTLYLADTLANSITAVPHAMTRTAAAAHGGKTVSEGGLLMEPLGLTLAPNGDILTTNAGDGNVVETTPSGRQLIARTADTKTGAGSLFGLLVAPGGKGVYFVDDGENTLDFLH